MKAFFYHILFFSLLFCSGELAAQNNLSGTWEGTIEQTKGELHSEYDLTMKIVQSGSDIIGRSIISIDGMFVEMEIRGSVHSGIFTQINDTRIIDSKEKDGIEWCDKSYQLIYKVKEKVKTLEGHWQGNTSFSICTPGKIFLKKQVVRA